MYAFITGEIADKQPTYVVLNCGGVGYEIFISNYTYDSLPDEGEIVTLYTYLQVREDAMTLFGFATKQEKEMFLQLITVSGVGAKIAQSILSGITPSQLVLAISTNDTKLLSSVKGLGKKTAERIILELKGLMGELRDFQMTVNDLGAPISTSAADEAIDALFAMGLPRMEAMNLVKQVATPDDTAEQIIMNALKRRG